MGTGVLIHARVQNICGVSVLDNSFERLKRLNLAEIFDPTPIVQGALTAPPEPSTASSC